MVHKSLEVLQEELMIALLEDNEAKQISVIEQLNEVVIAKAQRKVGKVMEVKFWPVRG